MTYTATSSDTAKATVSVSGATVTITAVAAGTATITVTATDPDGLTANQTFSVTTNNAPTAVGTIPNRTLVISGPTSIEFAQIGITGYFSDADGDALTYSVSYPLWRNVATADFRTGSGTVTITPISNGTSGTITVTVTATDTAGASVNQSFSVTVNRSPTTVGTIADRSLTRSRDGSSLTVDVSSNFSDPDGETLTYTASSSDTAVVTVDVSSAHAHHHRSRRRNRDDNRHRHRPRWGERKPDLLCVCEPTHPAEYRRNNSRLHVESRQNTYN